MKTYITAVFSVVWMTFSSASVASTSSEIQHLLRFVTETSCDFERNGKRYSGDEAVEHIQTKYDYFEEDIETAEDFITYAATKSTMSGRYYMVHCEGQSAQRSQDWLLAELASYRAG